MRGRSWGWAGVALALLGACSPALNWRSVHSDAHSLQMLLPCKPDAATRDMPMAGSASVALDMQGCDAGGATFAVSHLRLADTAQAGAVLDAWKTATLANIRGTATQVRSFSLPGAWQLPQSLRISAEGQRADGSAVKAQGVWFVRVGPGGVDVFHAVVYAEAVDPAVADTFFSGLKFE